MGFLSMFCRCSNLTWLKEVPVKGTKGAGDGYLLLSKCSKCGEFYATAYFATKTSAVNPDWARRFMNYEEGEL